MSFLRRPQNLKKSLSYFWQERRVQCAQQRTCQRVDDDLKKKCGQVLYKLYNFKWHFFILDHCVQIALTTLHMKKRKRTSASKEVGFFHCGLKKLFEIFSIDQFNSVSSQQSLVLLSRQHIMFWGCHMLHCLKENNYCFLKSLFLIERKIFSLISP